MFTRPHTKKEGLGMRLVYSELGHGVKSIKHAAMEFQSILPLGSICSSGESYCSKSIVLVFICSMLLML